MKPASVGYLVSIHDVMPATLGQTCAIFERLNSAGLKPVTLLVVPDTGWDRRSLDTLLELVDAGAELAGHGWSHRAMHIRGIRHRLHSALISRDVAEHLALDATQAIELVQRCHAWFEQHELPRPSLYVPPAWAMGPVSRQQLHQLPFQQFETLAGVYDCNRRRFLYLPMLGYEVDTRLRAVMVKAWNASNKIWARQFVKTIRLGIHPYDFDLRLAEDLQRQIESMYCSIGYSELPV